MNIRSLRAADLVRLLNSTRLGTVLTSRELSEHRDRAGLRIAAPDGRTISLVRYVAWLIHEYHSKRGTRWIIPWREWLHYSGSDRRTVAKHLQQLGCDPAQDIDLRGLIPKLHTWMVARNREALRVKARTSSLERFRAERAKLARLDRMEREGKLLPLADLRAGLAHISHTLRSAAERLEDAYGRDAGDMIREVLAGLAEDFRHDQQSATEQR